MPSTCKLLRFVIRFLLFLLFSYFYFWKWLCLKWPIKNRQNKYLNDKWYLNGGQKYWRMLPLEYFWPALSDNWSWKPMFLLFESGHFRQVLLYVLSTEISWAGSYVLFTAEEQMMNQNTILIMVVVGLAVVVFLVILYCFQQRQRRNDRTYGKNF